MSSTALKALSEEIEVLEATAQVVHAFELLAMVHLPSLRKQVDAVGAYTDAVLGSIAEIAEHGELRYSVEAEGAGVRDLVILVSSSMGMCGAYNQEVFAAIEKHLGAAGPGPEPQEADFIVIGTRGLRYVASHRRTVVGVYDLPLERVDVTTVAGLAAAAIDRVRSGLNRRVVVAYTHYHDVVTFTARVDQLYPLHLPPSRPVDVNAPVVDFELAPAEVLAKFVDSYAIGQLYAWIRYSVASEYGMRRMTTNVSKRALRDTLTDRRRQYRKARMAAESAELLDVLSSQQAVLARRTNQGPRDD